MTARLVSLTFDANDPDLLREFWTAALSPGPPVFDLRFERTTQSKVGKNRFHLDLNSSSVAEQHSTVERLLGLGATHVDIGQSPDDEHVVLADPEGNELCVLEPGNFVADGGFVGSITVDASAGPAVGYFWAEVLDWSLVWDQDGETAIRAPDGTGQFVTFGPPLPPKPGKNRLHLDIAPVGGDDHDAEVSRLLALGATAVDIGQGDVPWAVLADPDGNEFCVLRPR